MATTAQHLSANLRKMQIEFTLDVNNPELMINFWSEVLRYELDSVARYTDPAQVYWRIVDPAKKGPRIIIQRVPEPVTAKTRIHFDVHVDDIEAEAKRAVELGAKRVDTELMHEVGATWVRMLDPESNPFCFVLNREK